MAWSRSTSWVHLPISKVATALPVKLVSARASNPPMPSPASGSKHWADLPDELDETAGTPALVEVGGVALIHATYLAQAVNKLKGRAPVMIKEDGEKLRFAQGKTKFTLHKMPADEYPRKVEGEMKTIGHVNGEAFSNLVRTAEVAVSKDEALPALCAVNLELGAALAALGTDRYRMGMNTIDWNPARWMGCWNGTSVTGSGFKSGMSLNAQAALRSCWKFPISIRRHFGYPRRDSSMADRNRAVGHGSCSWQIPMAIG